ncbi:MAG: YIP1 family protein [Halodesulfurarchaeum sp.]
MVPTVLVDPNTFFERRSDNPGWLWPTVIVILAALVGIVGSVPVFLATIRSMPEAAGGVSVLIVVVGSIGGVIGTLVFWVLYAIAFHAISSVGFGGVGPFSRTLKLTGWGFIPHVFSGIVSAAANFYVFSGVSFPSDPVRIGQFVSSLRSDPVLLIVQALGIAFLLWSAFLWVFAIHHGRDVTVREATISVGIPVLVVILFRLYNIVGGL